MSTSPPFSPSTVGHLLTAMVGVWHDHCEAFLLDGSPLAEDTLSGSGGKSPYDNLVYIDFDGVHYTQTNVTFRGRPLHVRTFTGQIRNGILHFDKLGPNDPGHIGIAAGPDNLIFCPVTMAHAGIQRYSEPDYIRLIGHNQRSRATVLYRDGAAVRTMNARGIKMSPVAHARVAFDPRGVDGPIHDERSTTNVFK